MLGAHVGLLRKGASHCRVTAASLWAIICQIYEISDIISISVIIKRRITYQISDISISGIISISDIISI